jgi:hypothetical protein
MRKNKMIKNGFIDIAKTIWATWRNMHSDIYTNKLLHNQNKKESHNKV